MPHYYAQNNAIIRCKTLFEFPPSFCSPVSYLRSGEIQKRTFAGRLWKTRVLKISTVRGSLISKKKNLPPFNADVLPVKRESRELVYQVPILIYLKKCTGNYEAVWFLSFLYTKKVINFTKRRHQVYHICKISRSSVTNKTSKQQ